MLFSSITFLYYFLPVTMILYYLVPAKAKNIILFLASLFFYMWGEPKYGALLLFSVVTGYAGGKCIQYAKVRNAARQQTQKKNATGRKEKLVLAVFVSITLGLLVFFKYMNFIVDSVNVIAGTDFFVRQIVLPVGISFYTFQILSYYVDVYRGEVEAEHNFINFAAYVTMFPQLIAGPIVRFQLVQAELKQREISFGKLSDGAGRFVCGLCKKVLLADSLGVLVASLEEMSVGKTKAVSGLGTAAYWVIAIAYTLQLYYDFSGYSDMAIGLGKMLGFTFPENFNYPFISKSISEFWRRWHMTLGSFFKDYLYIPLGGSRVPVLRWCFNMFVVWFLSGVWHGAGWNFALWGVYFGVFLSVEKLIGKKFERLQMSSTGRKNDKPINRSRGFLRFIRRLAGHGYVCIVILISFVIFRSENLGEIRTQLYGMTGVDGSALSAMAAYEIKSYAILLFIAVIGVTPAVKALWKKYMDTKAGKRCGWLIQSILIVAGLILSTAFLLGSSVHPFLYFRF